MGKKLVSVVVAGLVAMTMLGATVSAVDLNDIGGNTTAEAQVAPSGENSNSGGRDYSATNDAIVDNINANVAIDSEDMQKAGAVAAPIVNVIRWVISIILVVFPALLILNSLIDFLCITLSPLRRAVLAVNGGGGSGGGMGGMGMGMGMGGMSGGGQSSGGGICESIAKWASDEAVCAVKETSGDSGGGMGGMGMGMSMGGMGGGGGSTSKKSTLITYFKKRTVSLVIAGVCLICFACTAFTDVGLELGSWIVNKLGGLSL